MKIDGQNFCTVKPVNFNYCPQYQILDCKNTVIINIAVPGFCINDLKVILFNGILSVDGKDPSHNHIYNECCSITGNLIFGEFSLRFATHCVDCVSGVFLCNGILKIILKKIDPNGVDIKIPYDCAELHEGCK